MIIIIGREDNTNQPRLHCVADGRDFYIGKAGSVPGSVSRQHCQLDIDGEKIMITNLNANNMTFVDDNQVSPSNQAFPISVSSKVQLGPDKCKIPVKSIVEMATGKRINQLVITLGREDGGRRLSVAVNDGKPPRYMGQAGSVPLSVSHEHCRLILSGITKTKVGKIEVENVKSTNVTYVNGSQVFKMQIDENSLLELGYDKFPVVVKDIFKLLGLPTSDNQVKEEAKKPETPTFSLKPLKAVWEEYASREAEIYKKQAKLQAVQRIQGLLSMCGMLVYFIDKDNPDILAIKIAIMAVAFLFAIYFFLRSMKKDTVQVQIKELQKEYLSKYQCPNPKCGKPFGNRPYHMVEWDTKCTSCGCKYTH